MSELGYTFDKDHKWQGTIFVTIEGHEYQTSGIIEYRPEKRFYAEIVFSSPIKSAGLFKTFLGRAINIGTATAIVVDDATKTSLFLTLLECVCRIRQFGRITRAIIYPRFLLASKGYLADPGKNKITNVDAEYNVWPEFNCPKGFTKKKKLIELHSKTALDSGFTISCREDVRGEPLLDFKADEIFTGPQDYLDKITDSVRPLVLEAQKTAKEFAGCISLKTSDSHRWYVRFENKTPTDLSSVMEYVQKSLIFSSLLMLLTHEWQTSIFRIYLYTDSEKSGPSGLLYNSDKVYGRDEYRYVFQSAGLNMSSFTQRSWSRLLRQFYNSYDDMQNHLSVLYTNNKGANFSLFHVSRIIDCLSGIGQEKKYKKRTKYQDVLENYLGKYVCNRLEKYLMPINSKNLGAQISDLRAIVVHFNRKKKVDIALAFNVYPILELAVIDFIFEKIKISKQLRGKYKNHYLEQYIKAIV
jgi:hypothetical protein